MWRPVTEGFASLCDAEILNQEELMQLLLISTSDLTRWLGFPAGLAFPFLPAMGCMNKQPLNVYGLAPLPL